MKYIEFTIYIESTIYIIEFGFCCGCVFPQAELKLTEQLNHNVRSETWKDEKNKQVLMKAINLL